MQIFMLFTYLNKYEKRKRTKTDTKTIWNMILENDIVIDPLQMTKTRKPLSQDQYLDYKITYKKL